MYTPAGWQELFERYYHPQKMKCPGFTHGIERFYAVPAGYKGRDQLHQMASFFGLQRKELKRVHALKEN